MRRVEPDCGYADNTQLEGAAWELMDVRAKYLTSPAPPNLR